MLGYQTMREVGVWIQTKAPSSVEFKYHPANSSENYQIKHYTTSEEDGNCKVLVASNLTPGEKYNYEVLIDGQSISKGTFNAQAFWQNDESLPEFKFATGSCAYLNDSKYDRQGTPFGAAFDIFEKIEAQKPEFMLWLGDNLYLRNSDFGSQSGIYKRYTVFKSHPKLQSLWKNAHHYAIWDDHDYGPNDADRSFYNKELTTKAFKDFWANQAYGVAGLNGITSQFSYYDLDFFLLDNRTNRSPNERKSGKKTILGDEQIEWLIDALVNSEANFKMVALGGQFLNTAKVWENYANYEEERAKIIGLIEEEGIKNVVFITGDRHKTELSQLTLSDQISIYDYTCSPLASRAFDSQSEGNQLQVEGTHVSVQNFGIISLSNQDKDRVLTISTFNKEGDLIWSKEIKHQ